MTACVTGFLVSTAVFLSSFLIASSFEHAAQDLTVERARRKLQTYFDNETVSTVAATRFLEALPAGGGDFEIADYGRTRELIRALGETEPQYKPSPVLERRANELIREVRVASAACALLFGLACLLLWRPVPMADASALSARIAACGAALIAFAYAMTWYGLGTGLQGHVVPAIVVATGVVLTLMGDAQFNDLRATRAAFDISRFWL
jgi:hypothetical protein